MQHLFTRAMMLSLALVTLVLMGAAFAQQDTWTGVERIVAVGDVHGDYDQFTKVLRAAEVLDEKENWSGGKTHLVQLGDVLDRGPDSRKVIDLLMKLEKQAAEAGGAVHALIGNHEVMVLLHDWRYVHPGEVRSFGGAEEFRKAMGADGTYGKWIRVHNAVVKINDMLFVHAGITPRFAKMSLTEINKAIRAELKKGDENGTAMDEEGPLWTRELAVGDGDSTAKGLDEVLKSYGASRMVIGHTVSTEGVLSQLGGRLIRIDVGMCKFYGGPAACLIVEKGASYEVRHEDGQPRQKRKLPTERPRHPPAPAQPSFRGKPISSKACLLTRQAIVAAVGQVA